MTTNGTKVCTNCSETKPITDFYLVRKGLDWRRSTCKKCQNSYVNDYVKRKAAEGRARMEREGK